MVSGSIVSDPQAILNGEWYILQMTGNSGEYLFTTYNSLCYPKQYYGIYAVQNTTDEESNHRRYYGFIFSNDGTGNIMTEQDYNNLVEQIKEAFTITDFYTNPQNEYNYDPAVDYSKGYSYSQIETLFQNTKNYYVMLEEQQAAESSKEQEEAGPGSRNDGRRDGTHMRCPSFIVVKRRGTRDRRGADEELSPSRWSCRRWRRRSGPGFR